MRVCPKAHHCAVSVAADVKANEGSAAGVGGMDVLQVPASTCGEGVDGQGIDIANPCSDLTGF